MVERLLSVRCVAEKAVRNVRTRGEKLVEVMAVQGLYAHPATAHERQKGPLGSVCSTRIVPNAKYPTVRRTLYSDTRSVESTVHVRGVQSRAVQELAKGLHVGVPFTGVA